MVGYLARLSGSALAPNRVPSSLVVPYHILGMRTVLRGRCLILHLILVFHAAQIPDLRPLTPPSTHSNALKSGAACSTANRNSQFVILTGGAACSTANRGSQYVIR